MPKKVIFKNENLFCLPNISCILPFLTNIFISVQFFVILAGCGFVVVQSLTPTQQELLAVVLFPLFFYFSCFVFFFFIWATNLFCGFIFLNLKMGQNKWTQEFVEIND